MAWNENENDFRRVLGALLLISIALFYIPLVEDFSWIGGIAIFLIGAYLLIHEEEK